MNGVGRAEVENWAVPPCPCSSGLPERSVEAVKMVLVPFFSPVWGRPSPGHAHPTDDSHHEQDLGPGGAGHAHGDFSLLLYWQGERSVAGSWAVSWSGVGQGHPLLIVLSPIFNTNCVLQKHGKGKVVLLEAVKCHRKRRQGKETYKIK